MSEEKIMTGTGLIDHNNDFENKLLRINFSGMYEKQSSECYRNDAKVIAFEVLT